MNVAELGRLMVSAKDEWERRVLEAVYGSLEWKDRLRVRAEMARCLQAMRGKNFAEVS